MSDITNAKFSAHKFDGLVTKWKNALISKH